MKARINWWLPLWAAVGTTAVLLSLFVYSAYGAVLYGVLVAPIVCLVGLVLLIVTAIRKRRGQVLALLLAMFAFLVVSGVLLKNSEALRASLRWLLWSERFKAEVLAKPTAANGEFQHVEWEASGLVGMSNIVYVVFDPTDSLAAAAKSHARGKFSGIPCEVPVVRRLESHWYSVWFYTDEEWGICGLQGS